MIRVLIADDQALVPGGSRMILETQKDIEVVGEASDAERRPASADYGIQIRAIGLGRPEVTGEDAVVDGWSTSGVLSN